jgi:hypothetical protein
VWSSVQEEHESGGHKQSTISRDIIAKEKVTVRESISGPKKGIHVLSYAMDINTKEVTRGAETTAKEFISGADTTTSGTDIIAKEVFRGTATTTKDLISDMEITTKKFVSGTDTSAKELISVMKNTAKEFISGTDTSGKELISGTGTAVQALSGAPNNLARALSPLRETFSPPAFVNPKMSAFFVKRLFPQHERLTLRHISVSSAFIS